MADVIFGGTLRFMPQFNMIESRPRFVAYGERLAKRLALIKADAVNAGVATRGKLWKASAIDSICSMPCSRASIRISMKARAISSHRACF